MTITRTDSLKSVLRLLRFLFWYTVVVSAAVYLLPWAGRILENGYDALSSSSRLLVVGGFFAVVAAWQLRGMLAQARQSDGTVRLGRRRSS